MLSFVSIVLIVLAIIYFFNKSKSSISPKHRPILIPTSKLKTKKLFETEENLLYKIIGIKSFDMKGMFYQDLNPKTDDGAFSGFANCEINSHDKYAVGIYNDEKKLLGYIPKGNKRLNLSLKEWHNGKTITWGQIRFDNFNKRWHGIVYIPVGYTSYQLEKLERVLKLKRENENQMKLKEKETEKYFEILIKHREISELLLELNNPEKLYYSFPKNLISSISSQLEKEKKWSQLIELEKHQDLINELSFNYKAKTLKRISIAKVNIN